MLAAFLTGVTVTAGLAVAMFFVKFWRQTKDSFFLLFALSFFIEAANRMASFFEERPNEADPLRYLVRFISFLLILIAIVRKNYSKEG